MDVREKLVELLDNYFVDYGAAVSFLTDQEVEDIADLLIAHGITFTGGTNIRNKLHTNADRIRAMSDEKLTDFICNLHYNCCECSYDSNDEVCKLVYWLEQPVEEEEND